jgi:hypothetical protein
MRSSVTYGVILIGVLATGCAEAPEPEIQGARQAIASAREAEASEYAPSALTAAEAELQKLDAELKAQSEKFALTRSYEQAKKLAAAAQEAGNNAQTEATHNKEAMRQEAATLIEEVKTELTDVKQLVETAPKGKGSEEDVAALRSDVASMEMELSEASQALASGAYARAKSRAGAVREGAGRVRNEILMAIQAKRRT